MRPGEAAFDAWSLAHVASGYALGAARLSLGKAVAVLIAYEVAEAWLRQQPGVDGKGLTEYESWPNIAGDIAAGVAGWYLAR